MWQAGKKLMPRRGSFKTLFDSMQLETCGVEGPTELDVWKPPAGQAAPAGSIYVDAAKGADTAAGTLAAPLKTIGAAMKKATAALAAQQADAGAATIVLRAGVYHGCDGQGNVCALGAAQSGLTITNYAAEDVTVTGGEPLAIAAADWKKVASPPKGNGKWKAMVQFSIDFLSIFDCISILIWVLWSRSPTPTTSLTALAPPPPGQTLSAANFSVC